MNNSYYTGYTTDLARRYQEHINRTSKCRYTRSFPPIKVAAFWIFGDKSSALKEEARIKKLSRKSKEKLIFERQNFNLIS